MVLQQLERIDAKTTEKNSIENTGEQGKYGIEGQEGHGGKCQCKTNENSKLKKKKMEKGNTGTTDDRPRSLAECRI